MKMLEAPAGFQWLFLLEVEPGPELDLARSQ